MISEVTEPTAYTSPQQSKNSSVNSGNQLGLMVLEGQEGGKDDMDLGSNDRKDGSQNEERKEQNQESQIIKTPINITSPCNNVATAAENIPNKQGEEGHQGNKNNHNKEESKEERRGGRGGGRGRGRGRD